MTTQRHLIGLIFFKPFILFDCKSISNHIPNQQKPVATKSVGVYGDYYCLGAVAYFDLICVRGDNLRLQA